MNQQRLESELERLIDSSNLSKVIMALSLVAGLKGEHIESNWQDKATAKPWFQAEKKLETLSRNTMI